MPTPCIMYTACYNRNRTGKRLGGTAAPQGTLKTKYRHRTAERIFGSVGALPVTKTDMETHKCEGWCKPDHGGDVLLVRVSDENYDQKHYYCQEARYTDTATGFKVEIIDQH